MIKSSSSIKNSLDTRLVKKHSLSTKYILLQTIMLIFIISIPFHFYIQSELENNFYKNKESLQIYAEKVEKKIYKFSNSNEKVFYYPRSNIYKSAIYDLNLIQKRLEWFKI